LRIEKRSVQSIQGFHGIYIEKILNDLYSVKSAAMTTRPKIKITDDVELRKQIDMLAESLNQVDLAKWAILCAKHVLQYAETEITANKSISNGFHMLESWQKGNGTIHQVRQAGFEVHAVARQCKTELSKTALRTAGHAIGVGHMREHAMVCSDYAIKTIQLAFPDNADKIEAERQWQLNKLIGLKEKN
jgi:hypothetical protein